MNLVYTWRCTSCPKPERVSVETSEDVAPVRPRCKKVMKTSDCCGCGSPDLGDYHCPPVKIHRMPKDFIDRITAPTCKVHTMTEEELDTPRPFGYYPPTTIDRRLDDTERMVDLLVERLGRVTVLPDDTEGGVRSALSEQIDRINGKLGVLLGGLDLS